jgi:hypothetical protein
MQKAIYLLAPALFGALTVAAQPTLSNNVFPEIGDQLTTIDGDPTTITQGNAGANQTWNFANLVPADSAVAQSGVVVAAAGTPYAAQFPQANLALRSNDTSYAYVQTTSTQFSLLGVAAPSLVFPYTNAQTILQTPLAFNGTFSDSYAFTLTFDFDGIPFTSYTTGNLTAQYDAYGTMVTPAGTFQNTMRLRTVDVQRDSANIAGFGYSISQNTTTSYDYYVANRPGSLVTISYTEGFSYFNIPGVPADTTFTEPFKYVSYALSGSSGIVETPVERWGLEIASISPNPTTDRLTVRFSAGTAKADLRLLVTDNLGRLVSTQELPAAAFNGTAQVAVAQLAPGTYTLTLTDGQLVQSVRFEKF